MQIPVTGVPRRVAAPTTPPAPQGGGGTVVPFNAPTASSFADTLRSLTQQTPASPSVTGNTTAQTGITYTPPAAGSGTGSSGAGASSQATVPGLGSSNLVNAQPSIVSGSSSDIAGASYSLGTTPTTTQAGGSSALSALLQGISLGGAGSLGSTSGGMTPMELMLVPLQNGMNMSALATSQGVGGTGALQMPFQGQAAVTQPFGPTSYAAEPAYDGYTHFHTGMDFGVAMDTPIAAAGTGKVVAAGWDNTGFGNRVIIDHGNGVRTLYGHLDKITVQAGQMVRAGQQIGLSGTTGNSSGPHLHFGVEVNGQWVDPSPYLAGQGASPAGLNTPTLQALGGGALSTAGTASSTSLGGIPLGLVLLPSSSLTGTVGTTAATGVATSGPLTDPAISGLIGQAAQASGLPSSLVAAVVQTESAGNAAAVSPAGAKGLMQLMDGTAAQYGVTNPFDPAQNLGAGTQYLSSLLKKYNGNEQLAVAAYNAGPSAVDLYGGIPPYPETQQYVQKVLSLQQQYGGQG
jgi:murein DD-endopeptidase MepM/ murein hydrolase activator NlpD